MQMLRYSVILTAAKTSVKGLSYYVNERLYKYLLFIIIFSLS